MRDLALFLTKMNFLQNFNTDVEIIQQQIFFLLSILKVDVYTKSRINQKTL